MRLLIVGGVAGGASAAARARRLSESAEIVLFERGPDVSFANCGMPYYIGGEIADRAKLLVVKPELLRKRFRIDVRTRTDVLSIDRARKVVRVRSLDTGIESEQPYDKLILSTGAAPLRPAVPGADQPGIDTLRDLADADRIKAAFDRGAKRAVIVGAGFIGLEMAENLVRRGIQTTVVEFQSQILPPLDPEMSIPIRDVLIQQGVTVRLGDSAVGFEGVNGSIVVRLKSGESIETDRVILGIGVRPENRLAAEAGLAVAGRGGVRVNSAMQTADPDIYAVGDMVEIQGFVSGLPAQIPLAGPANRQGRIAADHIFGKSGRFRGSQGTAIIGLFGWVAGMTGESEKSLRRLGRAFQKVYVHPAHHAGYYPGAKPLSIKLLFNPETGKILGGQVVGQEGVDRRIDVLAMAIQAGFTVFDLEEAELAYAPQFGSAKDPINMVGFVAANVVRGDVAVVPAEDLKPGLDGFLVDVRTPEEFARGSIPGAVNIPVDELRDRLGELPKDRRIVTYCQVGQRGYIAATLLKHLGLDTANVPGGYRTYELVRAAGMVG